MDTMDAIKGRRSIRSFKPDKIDEKDLKKVLDVAIYAPNARNTQQWHFSVIRNQALLDRFVEVIKRNINASGDEFLMGRINETPNYHTFYRAPTVVMFSGPIGNKYSGVDCGAAAENMCLAAESLGIASIVLGSPALAFAGDDAEQLKKEVKIPADYELVCSVALGYMDGQKPVMPHRNKNVFSFID